MKIILIIIALIITISSQAQKSFGFTFRFDSTQLNYKIISVFHNSPAEKAGLKNNDLILEINNKSIQNKKLLELPPLLTAHAIFKIKRDDKYLTYEFSKSELTADTAFHRKLKTILSYADSSFIPLKGEDLYDLQDSKNVISASKMELSDKDRSTVLELDLKGLRENYNIKANFISTPSKELAEKKFQLIFDNIKDALGIDGYFFQDDSKTDTYYKRYFIGRALPENNGYQQYRMILYTEQDRNRNYQVILYLYGGLKPFCYKLNSDSVNADLYFRSMLLYFAGNVFNGKIDTLKSERENGGILKLETYKTKYCFKDALSCKINFISMFESKSKTLEIIWPSVQGQKEADKLFQTLWTNLYNSLNNQFVYYLDQDQTQKILYKRTYVFANDNKIMPDLTHEIRLREQYFKSKDEYKYSLLIR